MPKLSKKVDYEKLYDYILKQAARDDLPQIQKDRYLYMLQRINELEAQGVDRATAVRKAYSGANIRYARERQKQAEAAGDTEKVGFFKRMRGHALTRTQKGQDIYTDISGGGGGGGRKKGPPLSVLWGKMSGKGPKLKFFEILFFIIAAILSLTIPPIFGIPPRTFLAIGFIFIAIYSIFPSEYKVLSELEPGEGISGAGLGFLTAKAFAKLLAFAFILADFFFLNRILALVFGFIFYFSLPFRYKTSQPYKMILAWVRVILGIVLAITIAQTFGGPLGLPLGLMSAAFFIAIPTHITDEERGVITVSIISKKTATALQTFEKLIFTAVMIAALVTFLMTMGMGILNMDFSNINVLLFFAVWGFSLITGWTAGPEARPAVGIIMIMISLFIFSTTYTGYVGQAIFGVWWPQIESFSETFLGPLGDVWLQAQAGLSESWLILTNPQEYFLIQQQKQQAAKSVVKSGGTIKSIEINKIELFSSIPGTLEPTEPVVGNIELQNQGEFESRGIYLNLSTVWLNPTTLTEEPRGNINNLVCSGVSGQFSGNPISCSWTKTTYPKEMKLATFVLESNSWGDLGSDCIDHDTEQTCTCPCDYTNITYSHSGQTVKLYSNLSYNYNVNVSIPFKMINSSLYLKKLQAGEIVLQDITSEYTGGPVKATLWTPKQPARTGEPYLVVASIYNEGGGKLLRINDFTLTVYGKDIQKVQKIASTFKKDSITDGCGSGSWQGKSWVITCTHQYGSLDTNEHKRVSLYITPNISLTDERTTQIIGRANYDYLKTKSQSLTIANAPPQ